MPPIKYIPNKPSKIALVGEAPGQHEMNQLQPFVGPEGKYFTTLLSRAGLNRYSCYITNTVHVQPFRNDYSTLKKEDLAAGKDELIRDLTEWKANGLTTVIAIGAKALELLTGKTGIYKYRGTALPCTLVPGLKVYSTVHPGSILRGEGKYEPIFISDIKKAVADSETSELFYPYRNIQIIQDEATALIELSLVTNIETPVVIDIETAGPRMTAFGWAISSSQAYVLTSPLLRNYSVLQAIGKFASSTTPKIFHNALYDVFHGAYYYKILYKNIVFDTMIAQHTAYPTLPKSLGFCSSIYTNEPYWKCLKGNVEVLTKYGWKRLDKLEDDEEVMVSTINGELQFERTKTISFDFEGVGYKVETLRHNCWYTPDHNILTEPLQRNSRAKIAAKDLTMRKNIITSGNFYHGTVFYKSIKLLVAIQADGHIDGNKVYFNLTKQRKVDRLYKLCKELEIDIKVSAGSIQRKRLECSIDGEVVLEIINRLGKNKDFNAWLLDMCPETLDAFLNELPLWDGWKTFNGDALNYSSNNWNNIQWVSTIGHLRNKLCHIGHAAGKDKNGWKVSIKDNYSAAFKPPQRKEEYFKGKVYCLNTSTGFFLARSNNHIFITGNSEGKEAMDDIKRGILSWEKLYNYNGKDCCLTYEIYNVLKEELTDWNVWEVFNDRMALLPACLYAQMRGLLLDDKAREEFAERNERAIANLEQIKEAILGDINVRSSKQLIDLIYKQWGMPVQKKQGRVTTEEKKLRLLLRYPTPYSASLGLILALKERYKLRDFYTIKTDPDGRVRCSMKITGTYTGRLATSASITGSGCVPGDHEVLTKTGWKSIKQVLVGEEIACWKYGHITFEKVLETHEYSYTGDLITSLHSLHPHRYTRTHRIPWTRPNRPLNVETAEIYAERSVVQIPAAGYYCQGKKHNPIFLRLIAMVQAGFSIEGSAYIRGSFKKERKKERARELLTQASIELGLDWKETTDNNYTRFTLKNCSDIVHFFEDNKTIPWSILDYDQESLTQFLDEVSYWNNHTRGNSFIYTTTNEKNKDIITTIAHLVGKTSSCRVCYSQGHNKPLYKINIKNKLYIYQENFKLIRKEPYIGYVYCVTVPTTFFLCRHKNQIVVTGNSNLQNQPKEIRVIYKADPGKILCQCDLSQSEARIVAALCGDVDWLKAFDEKDLHKEVAAFLYDIPIEQVQKDTHRLIAKRVAHGTHYGMGYMLLSEILECPPAEAKRLRTKYMEYRSKLKTWHNKVKQQIREKRYIRTCFGVTIQFFGPLGNAYNDSDTVGGIMREAVAAEPQSTSVSYINQGIVKCFNEIPEFDFLLQVHDSILFQLPDEPELVKNVLHRVQKLIEVPITINGIEFIIPLNFEIGYNWGTMVELKSIDEVNNVRDALLSTTF